MKIFLRVIKYFFLFVFFLAALPYLLCPIYHYPETSVFKGGYFYNPYENLDTAKWLKANFHGHTRVWWGLTYGHKSNAETLVEKYKELGFDITGISDYQHINPLSSIPVYEHGTGITKNHQLSIGCSEILWKEYLLWQNFHHKQDIISALKEPGNLITINHPDMRKAYDCDDLKYLRGVDLLEVINHNYFNAQALWDSSLSNGLAIFLIANDDTHDITNPKDFGYAYTLVNSSSAKTTDVINALRSGNAVGVEIEPPADLSVQAKLHMHSQVPKPLTHYVKGDSLFISFDKLCDTLRLIGQNGAVLEKRISATGISYRLKPEDTYVRAEINQGNLSNILLNPVIRYNGTALVRTEPQINSLMTWLFRGALVIFAFGAVLYIKKRRQRKK